ncbi:MAG TPA: YfhO family protein, partial [Chitinophagaceae bacterium]
VDKPYLSEDKYVSKDELEAQNFTKTTIDNQLLADTTNFRVFNAGQERFSASDFRVSTYHKAIGGYHPAKLRIYQDVIERYLSAGTNQEVLNMLNTKYVLAQNPQNGQMMVFTNVPYGPAWLVKHVSLVKDDAEELQALGKTNLKDTAIVQTAFSANAAQPQWDSTATIKLSKFDNDEVEYSFNAGAPQFAVFSEVYYPYGWNAYIDGKKAEYVKTNYVLRGLSIPAGSHNIKFVYEPAVYKKGVTIAYIGSYLVALFFLGGLFMHWRESKKKKQVA